MTADLIRRTDALQAIAGAFADHRAAIRGANRKRGTAEEVTMAGHEMLARAESGEDVAREAIAALAAAPAPSSLAGGEVRARLENDLRTRNLYREEDGHTRLKVREDDLRTILAALSPEAPGRVNARGICEALGFDPTNHHNAAACPYCIPDDALRDEIKARALTPRHEAPAEGAGEREPEAIYLQPSCCVEPIDGRQWSADPFAWEECDHDEPKLEPSKYVRAGGRPWAWWIGGREIPLVITTKDKADWWIASGAVVTPLGPITNPSLRARSSAPESLGNLLAVIHRDGGHRTLEVGVERAVGEAIGIVTSLLSSHEAPAEGAGEEVYNRVITRLQGLADHPFVGLQECVDLVKALRALETRDGAVVPEIEPLFWAWLKERDLCPDTDGDGSVDWADIIVALDEHEVEIMGADAEKLREFGKHTNLDLAFLHGNEDEDGRWQVHQVNGGVNDREWTLIGSGNTPAEAIDQALAALKPEGA